MSKPMSRRASQSAQPRRLAVRQQPVATTRAEAPAVGDFVEVVVREDETRVTIQREPAASRVKSHAGPTATSEVVTVVNGVDVAAKAATANGKTGSSPLDVYAAAAAVRGGTAPAKSTATSLFTLKQRTGAHESLPQPGTYTRLEALAPYDPDTVEALRSLDIASSRVGHLLETGQARWFETGNEAGFPNGDDHRALGIAVGMQMPRGLTPEDDGTFRFGKKRPQMVYFMRGMPYASGALVLAPAQIGDSDPARAEERTGLDLTVDLPGVADATLTHDFVPGSIHWNRVNGWVFSVAEEGLPAHLDEMMNGPVRPVWAR